MGSIPLSRHFGPGTLFTKQGIYEQSSTAKHRLGERLQVGERVFRYASAGEALAAGLLVQQAALSGADTTLQTACSVAVAASAGDTKVYINAVTTAQAANLFDDGWASIYDASATSMYTYRIKTNSALATSGTSSYIELYDPLHIALTTSDKVDLTTNVYKSVIQSPATTSTGGMLGVAPIAVTSGYYFWLQTWGPCAIFSNDGPLTAGKDVVVDLGAAGSIQSQAAGTNSVAEQTIGFCLNISTDTYGALVYLKIAA